MSPFRPDLVECWIFRLPGPGRVEVLLVRRSPSRTFPGLWQCVTGRLEEGERVPMAALREVAEEVGLGASELEAFYDLDQVTSFYDEGSDAVVSSAIFAVRVGAEVEPTLSQEHNAARWVGAEEAAALVVWPSYRSTIERIVGTLLDPGAERWFRLELDGHRVAR
jgi:dATP pyrophosphohydrolase